MRNLISYFFVEIILINKDISKRGFFFAAKLFSAHKLEINNSFNFFSYKKLAFYSFPKIFSNEIFSFQISNLKKKWKNFLVKKIIPLKANNDFFGSMSKEFAIPQSTIRNSQK